MTNDANTANQPYGPGLLGFVALLQDIDPKLYQRMIEGFKRDPSPTASAIIQTIADAELLPKDNDAHLH